MNNYKIAHSEIEDANEAIKSIKEQLKGFDARMILFFVSSSYDVEIIGRGIAEAFPDVRTVGCTTAGEMVSAKMGNNSIAVMAWGKSALKYLQIEILENVQTDIEEAVAKSFQSFENTLGQPMKHLDSTQYVGVVMVDGLSGCEELLNDQLGNRTNILFVGGSAGDDFNFKQTNLFVDGKAYTNAAILILMEPTNGFFILKTQSFTTTNKKLTPTKVDEKQRMVIEFNGKPATEAYAEILGISVTDLEACLGEYPVGLVFDEENFFVRSPMKVVGTSIVFYCSVKEGLDLTVLHSGDIVTQTRADLKKCGEMQAVVDFNCCLRALELKKDNKLKDYSEIFANVPAIGFATYGESYIGHINQTSTMLILK